MIAVNQFRGETKKARENKNHTRMPKIRRRKIKGAQNWEVKDDDNGKDKQTSGGLEACCRALPEPGPGGPLAAALS
jgi:hypothetical protein